MDGVPAFGGENPECLAHDGELVFVRLHREHRLADDEVGRSLGQPRIFGVRLLQSRLPVLRNGLKQLLCALFVRVDADVLLRFRRQEDFGRPSHARAEFDDSVFLCRPRRLDDPARELDAAGAKHAFAHFRQKPVALESLFLRAGAASTGGVSVGAACAGLVAHFSPSSAGRSKVSFAA